MKYFPYEDYEINGVATTPYSPNMKTEESEGSDQACLGIAEPTKGATPVNAYAERLIRSVRAGVFGLVHNLFGEASEEYPEVLHGIL